MITKIKSFSFKSMALLMAFAMLLMSFTIPAGQTVVLKAGTVVPLSLLTTISSKSARSGQIVDFRVTSDIKVNESIVIKTGSIAHGQITHVKRNGLLGTQGEIEVKVQSVNAVDGTTVYLTGNGLNEEGNNQMALSIVLTVCCILGFLLKGGNAEIPAGTQCLSTVMSNVEIGL